MGDNMTSIVCAIIGSGALSSVISALIGKYQLGKQKDDAVIRGLRALLRDRINERGQEYIDRGYIDPTELDELIALHAVYHNDLGGNGYLDTLMQNVKTLPIGGNKE